MLEGGQAWRSSQERSWLMGTRGSIPLSYWTQRACACHIQ